ncbi:MAG: tripartite tricarboxylate transporter substrate binding protein [Rhodospirillaceae bacterium]|nr:tripartite tricarboxylate transporter substrate binding protein [Rhodospirillaceae bacterium]MBT7953971.1 tripartite tricarboxylate transporter substrate binding protein [Rhodospirillaceae bacterium]
MTKKIALSFAAASFALAGVMGTASAGFPEKDITFLIPFSPGGGMDSTSRQIAKTMSKYLPNKVNVVPKNVPGAGGRKGYGLLAKSKPDGYTISVINMPGAIIPQLTGKKVNFDVTKFVWVGRMSTSPYLLGVSGKSAIKSLKDIKNLGRALKIPSTGFGSTAYTAASVLKTVVNFPVKFVSGYKGSKAYIVGVVRGDGDAAVAPTQTFRKFVKSGDIRGIVSFEAKSSIKGVPTIADAGYPELTGLGVERMVAATPGTPAAVAKILSDAIAKAANDVDSQAWAKKTRRPFSHLTGSQTQAAVDNALGIFKKYPAALAKQ